MKKIAMLVVLILSLMSNGCVSSTVKDAVDAAGDQVRLKWSEEWKPLLLEEIKETVDEGKEAAVTQVLLKLKKYKADNNAKLAGIGIKIKDFDKNKDGKMSADESMLMLQEIKKKNDEAPNPLQWWEILMAVAAAYIPLTGVKELAKKKVSA